LDKTAVYLQGWFDERQTWVNPPRLVNGDDLMQIFLLPPGRLLGDILDRIREAQAAGEVNSRDEALELTRKIITGTASKYNE
jgi:hypothetical protein